MSRAVSKNLAWLFGERVVVTLLVFVSNVYVIRYLGAQRFGQLALFQVYLALTLTSADFGLRRVFLALARSRALGAVLTLTVRIKFVLGLALAALLLAIVLGSGAPPEYLLLAGVALAAPLDAYVYHFEAGLRNDLIARIRIVVAIGFAAIRVGLCAKGFDVAAIAVTYALPPVLLGTACRVFAAREPLAPRPRLSPARIATIRGQLLRRAAFLFGSVLVVQLHARTDQLLVSFFAGPAELGLYAGAYKFLEQMMMIPVLLNGVLLPAIGRRRGAAETARALEQVYFATFLVSLGLALVVAVAARPIVDLVLGAGFERSADILAILAWGLPGLFVAAVSGLFYSLNGLEHLALLRNLAGFVVSVLLGVLLVPRLGAEGAAWTMVASYSFLAFGFEWCAPRFRRNVRLKLNAFISMFSARSYGALIERMGRQDGFR